MSQLFFLYESQQEREYKRLKFFAALNGIDLDKELTKVEPQQTSKPTKQNNFMFGDPAEYEKMNEKERESLTKKMMGHYQHLTKDLL